MASRQNGKKRSDAHSLAIGEFDHALLVEVRMVVAVVFALGCALALGWTFFS